MLLFAAAYLAGVLTILSPCILPVLPFVFARADRSFARNGLPMLIGMALTFAVVASLAAVAGNWAVEANRYGRIVAIALLALFGLALLVPEWAERATRPLVALGARLSSRADATKGGGGIGASVLLGIATGLVWAPCAGPVLGLILTGAALQGASVGTSILLLAYAAGAATSLALAFLAGGKVFAAMKRSLGAGVWLRRGLGALVLIAVAAIAAGLDTGLLTRLSATATASLEQGLIDKLRPETRQPQTAMMAGGPAMMSAKGVGAGALPVEGNMPALDGAVGWLNSAPLTPEALRGKVVLVDFWTYSCINCLRAIPYVRAWAEKYKGQGLVVVGVHTPEFAFEKSLDNVRKAVADLGIAYPVAIDNDYAVWRAFDNRYWPAHYFIDAQGRIRHHHFGEGSYDVSERVIQQLLAEARGEAVASGLVSVNAGGAQAASTFTDVLSPETYLGYERAENFASPGGLVRDAAHVYAAPGMPKLNEWGLAGAWTVRDEHAALDGGEGRIVFRFHARDLHLVLGAGTDGAPVRFRVTIDGKAPGADHGVDTDADGQGTVTGQRLYQLVRQKGDVAEHTFEIRFLDPGVEAYAFTFG
ncbi:MAG: cytochrome C biogenesis protein [Proteobacteria bacterium]|nr:MAG: cytochrome C biogenesis protein [Pseudomonadota bacterium]